MPLLTEAEVVKRRQDVVNHIVEEMWAPAIDHARVHFKHEVRLPYPHDVAKVILEMVEQQVLLEMRKAGLLNAKITTAEKATNFTGAEIQIVVLSWDSKTISTTPKLKSVSRVVPLRGIP